MAPRTIRPVLIAGLLFLPALIPAQAFAAPELTLKRVMLSSGGVGYFEYEAEVDGAATLGLDVPLEQVDDVLKSLVVFDSAGGVGGISLPGKDGARAAFGDVPFGPEALQSPIAYINALQGVEVEVKGPKPMRGRILRAEAITDGVGPMNAPITRVIARTRVSLFTAEGLQQFVLEDADAVQIADADLRARVGRALDALRRNAGRDMRHITLTTAGTAKRTVRVGYVAAAPLWKASYRLVLPPMTPGGGGGKARMQGWAVLENQTGTDWSGVQLTLQYGNPVTFRQAIYASYYVDRPEVPVQILGRMLPTLDTRARDVQQLAGGVPARSMPMQQRGRAAELAVPLAAAPPAMAAAVEMNMAAPAEQAFSAEGAEQTTFRLPTQVALPAGHTASVPILDQEIDAERLDLAEPGRPRPFAAIRLNNNTGLSLPAGVLALYDPSGDAAFAGDARLGGLPAGERRLVSFAEDLRTTVERAQTGQVSLVNVAASNGLLRVTNRDRQTIRFTVTGPAREARRVLLEIPRDPARSLEVEGGAPAGMEETATVWRLPVDLKPGEVRRISVNLDRTLFEETRLIADDERIVVRLLSNQNLPAPARAALERIATLRADVAAKNNDVTRLQKEIEAIERDQDRARRNLGSVPSGDALHRRLIGQLDAAETKIATTKQSLEQAQSAASNAQKTLADAVASLKI